MKTYSFDKQLKKGEVQERRLDEHFSDKYHIFIVPLELQRKGIDRIFVDKNNLNIYKVEYKSDFLSDKTGNIFIETCSIYKQNDCKTLGWAYTSQSDYLIYNVVYQKKLFIFSIDEIRKSVKFWKEEYGEKSARNKGYVTKGVPVPMDIISYKSIKIINLS